MNRQTEDYISLKPIADRFKNVANSITDNEIRNNGVLDFTKDGKCSGCGQCCSNYLPISSKEIKEIKRYVKNRHITEQKHNYPSVVAFDLTCPFLDDSKEKEKCLIYPVRSEICRDFVCNNPNEAIKNKKLMYKKYAAVDMREIFFGGNGNEQ